MFNVVKRLFSSSIQDP